MPDTTKVGVYHGRLACDGNGNLLDVDGFPVAYSDGQFVYVQQGEPSHNERHHKQFAVTTGTVDSTQAPDNPELVNVDGINGTNMHHFGVLEDDPHYEEGATNSRGEVDNTRTREIPDAISSMVTGHTDAISSGAP